MSWLVGMAALAWSFLAVSLQFARQGLWAAQVEHRTTDSLNQLDSTGARGLQVPVRRQSRLLSLKGQPVNGNGGAGEAHILYKIVPPFGTWRSLSATVGEAIALAEADWTLSGEGVCAQQGIRVGSILRVTGVVAADTPDRVITRIVLVTAITLAAGSADVITVQDVWTSVDRAMDTAATLELYDTSDADGSRLTEDVWRDVTPETKVNEALSAVETDVTLAAEGDAADAGIVVGSILRTTATETGQSTATEVMLVTAITLAGGQPDVLTVLRGFWNTTAKAFDADASKLERLEGAITTAKDLNSVTDNTVYDPATLDDDQMDLEAGAVLHSLAIGNAEVRVDLLLGPN